MNGVVRFRALTVVLSLLVVASAVALLVTGRRCEPMIVLLFGLLMVFAEHQDVSITPETSFSAGLMFATAGVIAAHASGSAVLAGLCIGIFSTFEITQFRNREWSKMVFNGAVCALATAAAGGVVTLLGEGSTVASLMVAAMAAAVAYFVVNLGLVVVSLAVEERQPVGALFRAYLPDAWHVLPFAVLGAFLGRLYLDFGATVVVLFVAPIFIARQAFTAYVALKQQQDATVRTLIGTLEVKDPYTAGHAERVAKYAGYVGEELHFSPARLERLRFAALMHDVGKLVVPNHLLNKPGRLTEEEFAVVKQHEHVSVEILTRIDFLAPVAPAASGDAMRYQPDAADAPIEPFIVAATDAYDAMTSSRSYRRALPQSEAFAELRRGAGTQFHPVVVDALIRAIEKRAEKHGAGFEENAIHADAPVAGTGSAGLGDLAPSTPRADTTAQPTPESKPEVVQ
ncbi:MAG: HD-GYP domain-containing protein [Acidimicrobiia bacterium]